jgi:hypothetical protein
LSPYYPDDAQWDLDGDSWTSTTEFQYGTSPIDPTDALQFRALRAEANSVIFEFTAVPHRTYTVLYRATVEGGTWQRLRDVPAEARERVVEVVDPLGGGASPRFYRVVSPAWP